MAIFQLTEDRPALPVECRHRILAADARNLSALPDGSIDLLVTSPPYPMIGMWDEQFSSFAPGIQKALHRGDGEEAFALMHTELDRVWAEAARLLKPGSFACVNIGDATRSIGGRFRLFPNHARILRTFTELGFDALPAVIWRKTTNAPNKFMGSGTLPAGAYVTLEHEYILIFRQAGKRTFASVAEKARRAESAFFWEERNQWFSDLWDLSGVRQEMKQKEARERSGAFPLELAWRLVNMYSLQGDTVLDPFAGTGTTLLAALAGARNSIGVEIDGQLAGDIGGRLAAAVPVLNQKIAARVAGHLAFMEARAAKKGKAKYSNRPHGFPVVTRQELGMEILGIQGIKGAGKAIMESEHLLFDPRRFDTRPDQGSIFS